MATNDFKDLKAALEQLREKRYPDLDSDFVREVLKAEQENPEDDTEALRAIESALKKALAKKGTP